MRRPLVILLSAACSALFMVAPAAAHIDGSDEPQDRCPAPETTYDYDTEQFAVAVTLAATGCPQREQRQFPLWVSVTRYDDTSAEGATRAVLCGPFRPSSDADGPRYSCDVDVALDHPRVEAAYYTVEVTYPDDDGDQVSAFDTFCVSDESHAACEVHGE
jgi:hypothetical protein